jgi:3-hydroxyisobutyrate dehydrogenase
MARMEQVGLVGAGSIGLAFVERLQIAGIQPTVFDVFPGACENARRAGARVVDSAAEVARQSTIVDVVVRTDQDMLDCTLGPDGLVAGAAPGTLLLLHSTIHPSTTRQVATAASARGVHVIDACMAGMPHNARAGHEIFLVGGPAERVERARPHLLTIGAEVVHFGPLTAGNTAKIIKNSLTAVQGLMVEEAGQFADAAGVTPEAFAELLRLFHRSPPTRRSAESRRDNPSGGDNMYGKDLPLAAALARELGLELPVTQYASEAGQRQLASLRG